jgi:hypothetical protein
VEPTSVALLVSSNVPTPLYPTYERIFSLSTLDARRSTLDARRST